MSIVKKICENDKTYEVRTAGASLRLYTNGVFHSQYNPNLVGHGSLWDMLAMPCQLLSDQIMPSGLILGVGGGAAIRYLNDYRRWLLLEGVDLDSVHLNIAKTAFGLTGRNIKMHHSEAKYWLTQKCTNKYAFIMDDLFGESLDSQGLPVRAVKPTSEWLNLLGSKLAGDGLLVLNVESSTAAKTLHRTARSINRFNSVMRLWNPRYENEVVVLSRASLGSQSKALLLQRASKSVRDTIKVTINQIRN